MDLKPFFNYYGGKWRVGRYYPRPRHTTIVEPFAGAAGYSVRHYQADVVLVDLDPVVAGVWDYLIHVTSAEVNRLPVKINHVDEIRGPQEARWLVGFWLNKGAAPAKTPGAWMRAGQHSTSFWGPEIQRRISTQVSYIRHWKSFNKSYQAGAQSKAATYFVDPPYSDLCGSLYRTKFTDYAELGSWCQNRSGQVIVCEKYGADWLPFRAFKDIKSMEGVRGKAVSREVIWSHNNAPTTRMKTAR